jgi:hypothetical protein
MARKDFRMGWAGVVVVLALAFAMRGETATHPSFSGTWELAPARSTHLGMMSAVKLTLVIVQTSNALAIKETSVFQGKASDRVVGYDLTGRPVTNRAPLGGASETVAHWEDDKLVVTWKTEGIAGGPPIVRTETRSLEPDGRTMSVEMSLGEGPSVIMVFERKK